MDVTALVSAITPEIYQRLKQAVETGKWPDGKALTEEQKASSMHTVMAYQAIVLGSQQHMTINAEGEVNHQSREQLKQVFSVQSGSQPPMTQQDKTQKPEIARFKQDDF